MLDFMPAILIEGPRYSGKTETARQLSNSEVLLDTDQDARLALAVNPAPVLQGETPRLIDEWQSEPLSWNLVRRACDNRGESGQFLLTGSAAPTDGITRHSGAGRIVRFKMRPMSLFEQGKSDGLVSLNGLLSGEKVAADRPKLTFDEAVEALCRGGWPAIQDFGLRESLRYCRSYVEEIARTDLTPESSFDRVRMTRVLASIARNIATNATFSSMQNDVDPTMHPATFTRYMNQLELVHVIEPQQAFATHLRSRARLRNTAKQHFCDPSLAVAALGTHPDMLKNDLKYLGFLFESLVVRDLRIYAEANEANVYFYRDNTGLEIDAIVQDVSGRWIPIEIKLGGEQHIESASHSLQRFTNKVDKKRMGGPAKMLVITCTPSYGYERDDGVSVVSIGSLGP
ncbi:ATP-binding protein [Candidatus Poribacteria bacterium]|nr:MAG: ATP-binding protein [Candidatus Poribacteria bacterium]